MDYIIDVTNKPLGRVATEISTVLQGKHTASFAPRLAGDTTIIVKNITRIKVSGRKASQKLYRRHTGYPGGLRTRVYEDVFANSPKEVLLKAVYGMLPANRLRAVRLKRLIIE